LSKDNYGSRKRFSIESALLEKRLIFDLAKITEEKFARVISDLEACFDHQFPTTGGVVEEYIGVKRKVINFITKVLPRNQHYEGTENGVRTEYYGGFHELLGGSGQGNVSQECV